MVIWHYLTVNPSAFQVVALIAFIVFIIITISLIFFTIRYPRNLPRVREKEGKTRFRLKTRLAYYTDCRNLYYDAYENVRLELIYFFVLSCQGFNTKIKKTTVLKEREDLLGT
jgi:hypothetical protein